MTKDCIIHLKKIKHHKLTTAMLQQFYLQIKNKNMIIENIGNLKRFQIILI